MVVSVILANRNQQKTTRSKIQGIVLPHHGLAKEILNNSFQMLKESVSPETIVIYGTNHYFPLSDTYTTTTEIRDEFKLDGILADNSRIKSDHSIQTILPYLKQYFPSSKVVPIIVSTKYQSVEDLDNMTRMFVKLFGSQETLYIASVDFAHNVSLEEGLNKNKESVESISKLNYPEILGYHDDHMDSPVAVTTLLLTMKNLAATSWQLQYSSHGALITNSLDLQGTSYVVGTFSN